MLPNFLFIGPDKAGSSWLYRMMAAHPACFVPEAKDLYFFDRYYEKGLDWYLGFFRDAPAHATAVGELSHDYLYSDVAAERIARHLPDVRLITALRDPVERTFSAFLYLRRSGLTRLGFDDALERFPELIEHGRYAEHLPSYLDRFPRERLLVLRFEDLRIDAEAYARRVLDFLGLPFVDGLPVHERELGAARPRSAALARLAKAGANAARGVGLPGLVGRMKRGPLRALLYREFADGERPELAAASAARLARRFEPDTRRLEALLGLDCSGWRRAS